MTDVTDVTDNGDPLPGPRRVSSPLPAPKRKDHMGTPERRDIIRQVIRSLDMNAATEQAVGGLVTHQFAVQFTNHKRRVRCQVADYSTMADTPAGTGYGTTPFQALFHACYAFLLGNESTVYEDGRYWDYSPVMRHNVRDLPASFLEMEAA